MANVLLDKYLKNLKFLKIYDNNLFQRIELISEAMKLKRLPQRYELIYIEADNNFDIFDNITKTYILDRTPNLWLKYMEDTIELNLANTISPIEFNWFKNAKLNLDKSNFDEHTIYSHNITKDIKKYTDICFQTLNQPKDVEKFDKFIFFGTLNGIHIKNIVEKIKSRDIFICEENLEIFRLSLFVCDYSSLIRNGKTIVFSVMDNDINFSQKFDIFWTNGIFNNSIYKFIDTHIKTKNYFTKFNSKLKEKGPFVFNYLRVLDNIIKNTTLNFNKYKTINFTKVHKNILDVENILFIGAGPSLQRNLKWLQKNQNKFIIVCMGRALAELYKNNITADIVTSVDAHHEYINDQFSTLTQEEINKIIKIISLNTHRNLFDLFDDNRDITYTFETLATFQNENQYIDGRTIGEVTFKILLLLNAKNIYLIGLDLSLNQETHETHIQSSDKEKNTVANENEIIYIDGNMKEKVKTLKKFQISLFDYGNAIKKYKKENQKVYNLSQNGAYISDTIPLDVNDLVLSYDDLDKKTLHNKITNNLNDIAIYDLSIQEKNNIVNEISFINTQINYIKKIRKNKIKTNIQFKEKLDKVALVFRQSDFEYSRLFFLKFYSTINNYINFILNDTNLKNDYQLINKFKETWCDHIIELLIKYVNYIKKLE